MTSASQASKIYTQRVYRDHPANTTGATVEFSITSAEALYIHGLTEQAKGNHFDEIKAYGGRVTYLRHYVDWHANGGAGGYIERRSQAIEGAPMDQPDPRFRAREARARARVQKRYVGSARA